MNYIRFLTLLLTSVITGMVVAQPHNHASGEFAMHYSRAMAYSDISLYAPCIEELNLAIESATRNRMEEQRITATISLAEVMRKTRDFDKALSLLLDLHITSAWPRLQVRQLGRIAAIYNEWLPAPGINQVELVSRYLDSALNMATALNLKEEQAGLYNELGYTISSRDRATGLRYLLKSAGLYAGLRDTHNYVGAMTNVLRNYIVLKDTARARAVINELRQLVQGRHWYTAETEFYKQAANYSRMLGDSIAAGRWESMTDKSIISNLSSINTTQMNAFRTLYETKKLKEQVAEMEAGTRMKQEALNRQAKRTRELLVYLSLLAILAAVVIALLLRERKLKYQLKTTNSRLQVSNEKYRMLMVESNHRIKNNLQMVISMMQYAEGEPQEEVREAFSRMAGKIRTIGILHKHLSADVRNERVAMDAYFNEIVTLYHDLSHNGPSIISRIAPVQIKSERLVYFGLVLNEMIANTIAHGNGTQQETSISVQPFAGAYRFDYVDGSSHDPAGQEGTGTSLIRQLIQRVGGTGFRFDPLTGHYQFVFHE